MNKAFILAAGLGTRLRPWTLEHPKALVPVGGVPMLERVIKRLKEEGFEKVVVNVHHFGDQIVDFLEKQDCGVSTAISDETESLLDTGGALVHAAPLLRGDGHPILIHNVDILSDAPLADLMTLHKESGRDISLLTSGRTSTRQLLFDPSGELRGWHNLTTDEYRPDGFTPTADMHESAFSGIYIINEEVLGDLEEYSIVNGPKFSIIDYFLDNPNKKKIGEIRLESLDLIDIGKPDTLLKAEKLFGTRR